MTLAEADEIAGQCMVMILGVQRLFRRQFIHNDFQLIQRKSPLLCPLEIFLELIGKNDIKHRIVPRSWHP